MYEQHKIFIYTGFLKAQKKEEIRGQTNRRGKGGKERMKAAKRGRRGKEVEELGEVGQNIQTSSYK